VTATISWWSVLAGVPQSTLEPLQQVQNAAVRLILQLHGNGGTCFSMQDCCSYIGYPYVGVFGSNSKYDDALDTHGKMLSLPEKHGCAESGQTNFKKLLKIHLFLLACSR